MIRNWFKSGDPMIWLNAAAVAASLIVVIGLLVLIAVRGLGHFWPSDIMEITYVEPGKPPVVLIGELHDRTDVDSERLRSAGFQIPPELHTVSRSLIKIGNRELFGNDFRWIIEPFVTERRYPPEIVAMERREWGNFYGYLVAVKENGAVVAKGSAAKDAMSQRLDRTVQLFAKIRDIEKNDIGAINYELERLRLKERRLELDRVTDPASREAIATRRAELQRDFEGLQRSLKDLYQQIGRDSITVRISDGRTTDVALAKIVRVYEPNAMGVLSKLGFYFAKIWEFVADEPREANTEGGIFPAIFGTVVMVLIMSILVTPLGVVAAVYLREYAKQGALVRTIRIAVNNLAGVPSIVYGVFGLGFFVYFVGGNIDQLFYPEALPAPTFGAPGVLWSSLTLALLTLPVVIVATEEGLARIPRAIREGSLALGATKAETLWRTVLPMATPAMMTGLILAVARAAGEVAPLMLVGVVKLAPSLPLDGNFPFMHLDRKFMHLGFHIYDVGFQSPNVEAARPLVYATSFLLVLVIVALNLAAIWIRNNLRERYRMWES